MRAAESKPPVHERINRLLYPMINLRRSLLAPMLIVVFALLPGCNDEDDSEFEMPDTTMMDPSDMVATGEADTIHVMLVNSQIDMPGSVQGGVRVFHVVNGDSEEHGFAISGETVQDSLTSPVGPGAEATLEADLAAGEYEVYCPIEGHAEEGERERLEVTAEHHGGIDMPQRQEDGRIMPGEDMPPHEPVQPQDRTPSDME